MPTRIGPIVTVSQGLNVTDCFATIGLMDSPKESFAIRLNALCDEAVIPEKGKGRQLAVAKLFGVTQKAARKWLEGDGVPEYERCFKIAAHFNIAFEWLMMGRGPKRISQAVTVDEPDLIKLVELGRQMSEPDRKRYLRMGSALAEPPANEGTQ